MDNRNCSENEPLEALKKKIASGKITLEDMNRRLETAIEAELRKPTAEMDGAFVRSCQDLLFELNSPTAYVSKAAQYERKWEAYRIKHRKRLALRRRALMLVSIASAFLVLFVIGDGLLRREWFTGRSTPDGQQYVLEGHVFDPGLVMTGNAVISPDGQSMTTDSLSDVQSFLGFTPQTPGWLPEGWALMEYQCHHIEQVQWILTIFLHENEDENLIYEVNVYSDMAAASDEVEQNAQGESLLIKGREVYSSSNFDTASAMWLEGKTSNLLYGPISEQDLLRIVSEIE